MNGLSVRGLCLQRGGVESLGGVDVEAAPGETLTLLGPSGAGKTSLLRCVAGLERPTAGVVRWDEEVWSDGTAWTPPERRHIGMVAQDLALWPHKTARGHLEFVLALRGVARRDRRARADTALDRVGLAALGDRRPSQISGGEAQRLALARALCGGSRVVLLDEPLAHLDVESRTALAELLRDLAREQGSAVLHVTHDPDDALSAPGRVVVLEAGRVAQAGSPADLFARPATPFVASITGRVNRVPPSRADELLASIGAEAADPRFVRLPDGTLVFAVDSVRIVAPGRGAPAVRRGVAHVAGRRCARVVAADAVLLVEEPAPLRDADPADVGIVAVPRATR